jgi:GNAT superfamily N-acetyltransferase
MRITTHNPKQVDVQRLAVLAGKARGAAAGGPAVKPDRIEGFLRRYSPPIFVLAHSGDQLVGWLGLWPLGDSSLLEINPGQTLGSHPFVSPEHDLRQVGTELIEEATTWARKTGFTAVYLDFPWDLALPQEAYTFYEAWYESLGFHRVQKMRHLTYDLAAGEIPHVELPPDFEIAPIWEADGEELYRCHYAAFEASDAEYFARMSDQERRADFQRIYNTYAQSHRASLVLRHSGELVGLTLVFSEGDHSTLDSIGVHPAYHRQGLGKCLLLRCLQEAASAGYESMFLICDVKNQSAMELYKKVGFEDQGGSITYQWKA